MRWPLRNQLFLPFAALLTVSVILVTVVSVWQAAANKRAQKLEHMSAVVGALGDANFPLTQPVTERIGAMIGGEVVVLGADNRISASTIEVDSELLSSLHRLAKSSDQSIDSLTQQWEGREYLVNVIHRRNVAPPKTLFVLIPQTEFLALQPDFVLPPLIVAVPTLGLALILAMLISRRIGARVDRLRDLFQLLSQGEFQSVSIQGRDDELRDLLTSANELSERLNLMQQELVRTERLQLLGQLSGGLAHQLRNSITGARLAIELHLRKCNADAVEMLDTAIAQLRLTEEQVLAVLSLRPDSTVRQPAAETTDMVTLVGEVRSLLQPQAAHWQSKLTIETDREDLAVELNSPACMKGALLNLVLNAIEAAGIRGTVRISVTRGESDVVISVLDNGSGFPDGVADLTESFRTTKPDGIGLGLTIAEHAVQQESGCLTMSREGGWTCVRVRLAVSQNAPQGASA